MKRYTSILALFIQLSLSVFAVHAQDRPATALPKVNGEIRKVDNSAGKLTIHHEDIPNLGMPGMTMVFRVNSPTLLDHVQAGDQVRFSADRIDGALTVMSIEPR